MNFTFNVCSFILNSFSLVKKSKFLYVKCILHQYTIRLRISFSPLTGWIIGDLHFQRVGCLHKVLNKKYSHGKYAVLPWGWRSRNKERRLVNRLFGDEQARMRNFFITSLFSQPLFAVTNQEHSGFLALIPIKKNFNQRKNKIKSAWRRRMQLLE